MSLVDGIVAFLQIMCVSGALALGMRWYGDKVEAEERAEWAELKKERGVSE